MRRGAVTQWDTYFNQYEPVFTRVPVMMVPGCVTYPVADRNAITRVASFYRLTPCCTHQVCVLHMAHACSVTGMQLQARK